MASNKYEFVAPTIEADGSIGEATLTKRIAKWRRFNSPFKMKKVKAIVHPADCPAPEIRVMYDDFELMDFGFRLADSERVSFVEVYVHVEFLKTADDRRLKIQQRVMELSPWLFTYGERKYNE